MRLRLLPLLALLAQPAAAAAPQELAAAIAREAVQRDRLVAEARRLQAEAAALAERVSVMKTGGGARAGGELSSRLRDFDRLAERLDRLESDIAEADRRLARRRREFDAAADAEERRLQERARREGAAAVAPSLQALLDQRRDVAARTTLDAFRLPLDVAVDPLDGVPELEAKLALLDGERSRVTARLGQLRGEEVLLAARLSAKREWARRLAAARRDAAGDLELLDRGYEDAERMLRELATRASALVSERRVLEAADERLKARRAEAEARLGELRKGR